MDSHSHRTVARAWTFPIRIRGAATLDWIGWSLPALLLIVTAGCRPATSPTQVQDVSSKDEVVSEDLRAADADPLVNQPGGEPATDVSADNAPPRVAQAPGDDGVASSTSGDKPAEAQASGAAELPLSFVEILKQIADVDPRTRDRGLLELEGVDQPVVPLCIQALKQDTDLVRQGAARVLLSRVESPQHPQAWEALQRLLNDTDEEVRHLAIQAARRLPPEALSARTDELLNLLNPQFEDAAYRSMSVQILRRLPGPDPRVAQGLLQCLKQDPDDAVRKACLYAVATVIDVDQRSHALAEALLKDPSADVRRLAAVRLGRLPSFTDQTIDSLVNGLGDAQQAVREAAAEAVVACGRPAVPILEDALASTEPQIRQLAVLCLGRLGQMARSAVPKIEALLQDEDAQVRAAAQSVLDVIKS